VARERHDAAFIVGALIGGVGGGLYGLWTAPQSGARTRADLAHRWDELSERAAQAVAEADAEIRAALGRDGSRPPPVPPATPVVSASGPFTEPDGAPVLLLPDPLEADPVVVLETETEPLAPAPDAAPPPPDRR